LFGEAGKHAGAEELLLDVLEQDKAKHGEDSLIVACHYYFLAQLCKLRSNTFVYVRDEKIQICRRGMEYIGKSLAIYEKHLPGISRLGHQQGNELMLRIGDCLCMLAGYLCTTSTHLTLAQKNEAQTNALFFLSRATTIYEKYNNEMGLAESYRIYAGIFSGTHYTDKEKAINYLEKSLILVDKLFGSESSQAADIMQKFAYMNWNWDRESVEGLEKSLEWHRKELEVRIKVMGRMHPITKRAREDVFIILERLSRYEEARELYGDLPPDEGENIGTD